MTLIFPHDDGAKSTITIEYEFFDDKLEMEITRISPAPSLKHMKEIYGEWNTHVGIHETASDIAYSERGDQ